MSLATIETLRQARIVAVVRGDDAGRLVPAIRALADAGIAAVEITYTVPGASRLIAELSRCLDGRALVGAGTVLDAATAREAIEQGARFVVSPVLSPEVIAECRRREVLVAAGALSPTEVWTAWKCGADLVKVFPCDSLGPAYLRALRAPFPQIPLMPTGGVTLANAAAFLEAGAAVLGAGSALLDPKAVAAGDLEGITRKAQAFLAAVARS